MEDIISFIVTVYNTRVEWIERVVNSIVNQTNSNWEIIIVDDGSRDDVAQFCDNIAANNSKIRIHHQENLGVCVARNYGTDHASGRWITYIDADDWIEETYVEQVNDILSKHDNLDLLAIGHDDIWGEKTVPHLWGNDDYHEFDNSEKEGMQLALFQIQEGLTKYPMFFGAQWKLIYSLPFLNRYGIRNTPGLKKSEDAVFNLYAVEYAEKIGYYNKVLYHYYHNSESVTGQRYSDDFERYKKLLIAYKRFIDSTGKKDIKEYNLAYKNNAIINFEGMLRNYFINKDNHDDIKIRKERMNELLSTEPFHSLLINNRFDGLSLYKKTIFRAMKKHNYGEICFIYRAKNVLKGRK